MSEARISNCPGSPAAGCPARWNALDAADYPLVRRCRVCGHEVHLCCSRIQAMSKAFEGLIVAHARGLPGEFADAE